MKCPYCHQSLRLVPDATPPSSQTRPPGRGRSYEHAVRALPSATSAIAATPSGWVSHGREPAIEPGEKRDATSYRELDMRDVVVPLAFGGAGGVLLGLTAIPLSVGLNWPPWVPPVVWLGSSTALFFASGWRIFLDKSLISSQYTTERKLPLPQPQAPTGKPPDINIHRESRVDRVRPQHRYPQIPTPAIGLEQLARWFWRVVRQGGVGFSQGVALNYHIQREEVKRIQTVFIAEDWALDRGGTQGVQPNDEGLDVMCDVIRAVYPAAPLPPERASGA